MTFRMAEVSHLRGKIETLKYMTLEVERGGKDSGLHGISSVGTLDWFTPWIVCPKGNAIRKLSTSNLFGLYPRRL